MASPDRSPRAHAVRHKFSSHSLRCTAAMCLLAAGLSTKEVAWRLRWNSEAIERYRREATLTIEHLSATTVQGACML